MIDDALLHEAASTVAVSGPGDAALEALRRRWPALRFVLCSDDDMPVRLPPAWAGEGFNFYLIGHGEHCISLTGEVGDAVGIVISTVTEE